MPTNLPRLLSVHVPKAAGSAMRAVLQSVYGTALGSDYANDPADPISRRRIDPDGFFRQPAAMPAGVQCMHGHFHPRTYMIEDDIVLFTVLRHPVENILSIYAYWRATASPHGTALHRYAVENNLDVLATARLPLLRYLYSDGYFGRMDMARFDIIGDHHRRGEALTRLSERLGVPLDSTHRENVTPPDAKRQAAQCSPEIQEELAEILADDIAFYREYAGE